METLYTIPVNMAFEECADSEDICCPFCRLYAGLEDTELEYILGASMMEPDVRVKTNEMGFCSQHFGMMLGRKNRLPFALMMESHLMEIDKHSSRMGFVDKELPALEKSCYVCSRIDQKFPKMLETAAILWDRDPEFKKKLAAQHMLCLPHYRMLLTTGKNIVGKKKYAAFKEDVDAVFLPYFESLMADTSWFCKKFDYRYDAEPWGTAKDAPERVVKFLCGDLHAVPKKK